MTKPAGERREDRPTMNDRATGNPEDGHTWEISVRNRGSSSVVGVPGHRDSAHWGELRVQTVRAWSLAAALAKAQALPLKAWLDTEEED